MSERDPALSGLLPPAPSIASAVEPLGDVHATMTLLGAAVDELAETVRALRRAANDESVDLRARLRELEGRLARLEASETAPVAPAAPPVPRRHKEPRAKLPKRARREARLAAEAAPGTDASAADEVRARIARQLKDEHRRRAGEDA